MNGFILCPFVKHLQGLSSRKPWADVHNSTLSLIKSSVNQVLLFVIFINVDI